MGELRFGTCSWKYDSWRGIIYPREEKINYLAEYAKQYSSVEVDQWFWSLFPKSVKMPAEKDVCEYAESVPPDFRFTVKAPNSITLTHYYNKSKNEPLKENPYFLSNELTDRFLTSLAPLHNNLGPIIFQFEYLNKQKMSSLDEFIDRLGTFSSKLSADFQYGIEVRNSNYLNESLFEFFREKNIIPVLLQGYYMPPIFPLTTKMKKFLKGAVVIRLHGPDRSGIEERTGGIWNTIIEPKNDDIEKLCQVLLTLRSSEVDIFVNVNNHFEGSAPLTIRRISDTLEAMK